AIILAIRAGMGEVSWGFNFKRRIFRFWTPYFFFVVGFNFWASFESAARLAGAGQVFPHRGGRSVASFPGGLAGSLPRPGPVPFMAAALGFALSQPAPQTVAVLLALGLGLALPYLLLAITPALQRLMPKPGPWMERLRQFLAFPMYASAVWMIWVLTQQTGADGVIYALGGMILIAFAIWLLRIGSGASP